METEGGRGLGKNEGVKELVQQRSSSFQESKKRGVDRIKNNWNALV